jgi:hypothetical protein
MTDAMDLLNLADAIAEIARTTTDGMTGGQLVGLVTSILEAAGLPPDDASDARAIRTHGWRDAH